MLFTPPENDDDDDDGGGNDSDTIVLQQHEKFETLIYLTLVKVFSFSVSFFLVSLT